MLQESRGGRFGSTLCSKRYKFECLFAFLLWSIFIPLFLNRICYKKMIIGGKSFRDKEFNTVATFCISLPHSRSTSLEFLNTPSVKYFAHFADINLNTDIPHLRK